MVNLKGMRKVKEIKKGNEIRRGKKNEEWRRDAMRWFKEKRE